jgi:hypothetical protein
MWMVSRSLTSVVLICSSNRVPTWLATEFRQRRLTASVHMNGLSLVTFMTSRNLIGVDPLMPRGEEQKGLLMKLTTFALILGTAVAVPSFALAQGASHMSPGHQMQQNGPASGQPGASGYAPGHQMQERGTTGAGIGSDIRSDRRLHNSSGKHQRGHKKNLR